MGSRKRTEDEQELDAQTGQAAEDEAAAAEPQDRPGGDVELDAPSGSDAEIEDAGVEEVLGPEQLVEALSAEIQELEDRHLRLVAEFDNFRKRTIRERAQTAERAQAELAKMLLESLDDLSRVSDMSSTDHNAAAILEGVQLVEQKLLRALRQAGLEPIEAVGKRFDPEIHDALITVPADDPDEDEVVSQEMAKGYLFKDQLLRPSLVEVKKYDDDGEGAGSEPEPESGDES